MSTIGEVHAEIREVASGGASYEQLTMFGIILVVVALREIAEVLRDRL